MTVTPPPFLVFLNAGLEKGTFEADDELGAILPLMRQTLALHEQGLVAPLDGLSGIRTNDEGRLVLAEETPKPAQRNIARVDTVQQPASAAIEIVGEARQVLEVGEGALRVNSLDIGRQGDAISRPIFLPGYRSWEHAVEHHDEVTDVFSLGMLLASLACGLDLSDPDDLELIRQPSLQPVRSQSTAASRDRVSYRPNDRAQPASTRSGFAFVDWPAGELSRSAGRARPQSHSRLQRVRRSRPPQSRPDSFARSLVRHVAAQPPDSFQAHVADTQSHRRFGSFGPRLSQHPARPIIHMAWWAGSRNHLRSADVAGQIFAVRGCAYIPGVLDKIISEARRDKAEYGFAQLRLVLVFLRWHNLKEAQHERIHSPLLLLPVELSKKRGVRDQYILDPTSSEAEVNPALRHCLKQLYNLDLPETVDLRETTLDAFHSQLQALIQASEPAVTLHKVDKPQIKLIHERARQRLDQFQRRIKQRGQKKREKRPIDYSYDRENFRPMGLQLFLSHIKPARAPMSAAAGAAPTPRLPHIVLLSKADLDWMLARRQRKRPRD